MCPRACGVRRGLLSPFGEPSYLFVSFFPGLRDLDIRPRVPFTVSQDTTELSSAVVEETTSLPNNTSTEEKKIVTVTEVVIEEEEEVLQESPGIPVKLVVQSLESECKTNISRLPLVISLMAEKSFVLRKVIAGSSVS